MEKSAARVAFAVLLVALIGCAELAPRPTQAPSDQDYIEKAQALEAEGHLVEALDTYKLARTVNPANDVASRKIAELEPKLMALAEKAYQSGLAYQRKGQYAQAQQEFLIALRYNPEHLQAQEMLSGRSAGFESVRGYILHVVQPGESLSQLAKRYYGDYKKFHLIAKFNGLDDATRVSAGQQVKVPVIEGIPILAQGSQIVTEGAKPTREMPPALIGVKRFVPHTIQAGETLSILSKRYYGDIRHYDLIALYNGLEDPTSIRVGQEVKIPQVEGLPFLLEEPQIEASTVEKPETPTLPMTTPSEKVEPSVEKEKRPSLDEQIAGYREQGIEFYHDQNYVDALSEFEKVLNASPGDQVAREYMALSYYGLGAQSYQNQDYPQAIQNFRKALDYDKGCGDCEALIQKSEESFKDFHYRRGLDYFKDEKLTDAIREWELVYAMDPGYQDVDRNLQKARLLHKRLEDIKRSRQEAPKD